MCGERDGGEEVEEEGDLFITGMGTDTDLIIGSSSTLLASARNDGDVEADEPGTTVGKMGV